MADPKAPDLDLALEGLPPVLRWREWMRRIEAVLFASAGPVAGADLARVVGPEAAVELLIADLAADLAERPYEVVRLAGGWMLRARPAYAPAIRAAAHLPDQPPELGEFDAAVLAAIACHQPITRDGLQKIFGREIRRELIQRLSARDFITTGPRSPRRGAPHTFVTTEAFLVAFNLDSLRDLQDADDLPEGWRGDGVRGDGEIASP